MENLNSQNNRITVRVPFSVLEVIDRIVLNKVNDGEANATRSSVALEEQLSYIAHTIVRNGVLAERFLTTITEFNKIPYDFAIRIAQGIKLSDEEKKELKRLFINMDFKQKKP